MLITTLQVNWELNLEPFTSSVMYAYISALLHMSISVQLMCMQSVEPVIVITTRAPRVSAKMCPDDF